MQIPQRTIQVFSYTFDFFGIELIYQYARFSNQEIREEELIINGVTIFKCDFLNKKYNFDNLKHVEAETANVKIYLQALEGDETTEDTIEPKLPFLRWLISNVALKNDSVLIRLSSYVRRMTMITVGNEMPYRVRRIEQFFL